MMRTTVSIPAALFQVMEQLAGRAGRSRSEVYSAALREYLARHDPARVTADMNRVCATVQVDPFAAKASRRVLERSQW
jgi:metal-responsive CopG/Arc/MetJ family transcriptional regulator